MGEELFAGMGEYVIGTEGDTLTALGLGSCIGCVLYDSEKKIAGLSHVMLPDSTEHQNNTNLNKFADVAIPAMLEDMKKKGCKPENITARIAGGAKMFAIQNETLDIGNRNEKAVKEQLQKLNIRIKAHDTGGSMGRTVRFDVSNAKMIIKNKDGIKEI